MRVIVALVVILYKKMLDGKVIAQIVSLRSIVIPPKDPAFGRLTFVPVPVEAEKSPTIKLLTLKQLIFP